MSVQKYSLKKDGNKKLSNNFTVAEFACKDGSDTILISSELVELLQKIREHFGKAVTINSAYRNAAYNKKIGGATSSQHVQGTAADIVVKGVTPTEVAKYAEYLMPKKGGIGVYDKVSGYFTHIDVRTSRARWKQINHRETTASGFPGYTPELTTGDEIVWELMNGKYKVEINEVDKAVKAVNEAKNNSVFSSLYWILYKLVNK